MRKLLFVLCVLCLSMPMYAQNSEKKMVKVPKQLSLESGYRYIFSTKRLGTEVTNGYGFLFDYAWKLSGLDGSRAAAYISVPLGYTILMPANDTSSRVSILCYGWTVRHDLSYGAKYIPYFSYGLLLNQMRIGDLKGSVMGHQTQFEFGMDICTKSRLKYFAKIQYSYTSFPQLNEEKRIVMNFADVRVGVRF